MRHTGRPRRKLLTTSSGTTVSASTGALRPGSRTRGPPHPSHLKPAARRHFGAGQALAHRTKVVILSSMQRPFSLLANEDTTRVGLRHEPPPPPPLREKGKTRGKPDSGGRVSGDGWPTGPAPTITIAQSGHDGTERLPTFDVAAVIGFDPCRLNPNGSSPGSAGEAAKV
jgi:hypothetical protein